MAYAATTAGARCDVVLLPVWRGARAWRRRLDYRPQRFAFENMSASARALSSRAARLPYDRAAPLRVLLLLLTERHARGFDAHTYASPSGLSVGSIPCFSVRQQISSATRGSTSARA